MALVTLSLAVGVAAAAAVFGIDLLLRGRERDGWVSALGRGLRGGYLG